MQPVAPQSLVTSPEIESPLPPKPCTWEAFKPEEKKQFMMQMSFEISRLIRREMRKARERARKFRDEK